MRESTLSGADGVDLLTVINLLVGFIESDNKKKKPKRVFLKRGSSEEKQAFKILSNFLRRDAELPTQIRTMLADLVDPDARTARKLVLQNRKAGKTSDVGIKRMIARVIFDGHVRDEKPIGEVLIAVSEYFSSMDYKTLEKLWSAERDGIVDMTKVPDVFAKKKSRKLLK